MKADKQKEAVKKKSLLKKAEHTNRNKLKERLTLG